MLHEILHVVNPDIEPTCCQGIEVSFVSRQAAKYRAEHLSAACHNEIDQNGRKHDNGSHL